MATDMPPLADIPLQLLLTWFSPAFPIGAFSYSHGLETAVEERLVVDRPSFEVWLHDVLRHGAGWNDAVLLRYGHAFESRGKALDELIELAIALAPSAELELETCAQGQAFARTTGRVWSAEPSPDPGAIPYPIAVGVCVARHEVPIAATIEAYLHAFAANLTSASVRLVPLGQTDGLKALAAQEELIRTLAADAIMADLDQLGGFVPMLEWCSMRHETQYTRLFRS